MPRWCSQQLPPGDFIAATSAPAIAQLDRPHPAVNQNEIIIDDKVFNHDGTLRYNGTCATCPRSRTSLVTNFFGPLLRPQVIAGRGAYRSVPLNATAWAGAFFWISSTASSSALVYDAVANLDLTGPPEIVAVDTTSAQLRVLSPGGGQLTTDSLGAGGCGGAPMIGNADGIAGPEIGVATCNQYRLYKYAGGTLTQLWSMPTNDPSGQTTSTLINTPTGARIFYADATTLWVFDGATGSVVAQIANSSVTGIEGPVIASSFPNGGPAAVFVAANDHALTAAGQRGLRIFDDPTLGPARSYYNQHTYHHTNVLSPRGAIPVLEQPNWQFRNTYRVQHWP